MATKKQAGVKVKRSGDKQANPGGRKLLTNGVDPMVGKATQFKPGQSGNPAGLPKGTVHLSTHIQNLLNDETFEALVPNPKYGWEQHKGAPMKAIISVQVVRAMAGDPKAADWLAKYGYGSKVELTAGDGTALPVLVKFIDAGPAHTPHN